MRKQNKNPLFTLNINHIKNFFLKIIILFHSMHFLDSTHESEGDACP